MAIPNNYIDKITNKDTGESRVISPAADKVRVENENFEGSDLNEVLDEVAQAIENAGSGDGTVTGVKVGSTPYNPDSNGVVDLSVPFADKATKSELQSAIDTLTNTLNTLIGSGNVQGAIDTFNEVKAFLNGIDTSDPTLANQLLALNNAISAVQTSLAGKANSADVYSKGDVDAKVADAGKVKSVTINGSKKLPNEQTGDVDLGTVQGEKGDKGDTGNVQVDGNGNVLIYNGRDMTNTGAALDASQGQYLGKLLNAKDNTFYNVWVGTQAELEALEEYEDNTIFIVGTIPTVVQRFNVSFNGGDHTSVPASTPQTVKEGSAFSVVVSPASGYTIDTATGTMVGGTLTKTNNQDGTVTFSTTSVTGAITIQAAATKHITGITVSAGTRSGNSIPLTAVVAPSGADNVTLAWSVNDDTNFGISGSGASATLTIKSGASNASVTITCQDTNSASGTAQDSLQLTGLTYEETPIPITEITDINATRTAANTLKLDATSDGNTGVSFSIVGTAPKVKKLDYTNDLATLEEVDNVVLNGDTLTYKEDCKVTIQASAENGTVTYQKEITIAHTDADAIWFEDEVTLAALNSNSVGSGGKVTYSQAVALTSLKFLAGNTSIRRFKEFMWFTGITQLGANASDKGTFKNCSNLECIGLPNVTVAVNAGSITSNQPFYGCKLREFHIQSLPDFKLSIWSDSGMMVNAGKSSEGLGLFINGQEVYDVIIPEGVGVNKKYAGFNRITSFTAEYITSFPVGSLKGCTALTSLKIGDGVTEFGDNALNGSLTNLRDVDLGSGISALGSQCFRGCTGLQKLTLRYDGVVTHNNSFYSAADISSIDLYVPASQVNAYQASSVWSSAKSINAITE